MVDEGLTGTVEHVVADADTALSMRSGDVAVLATPKVVALCEEAAVAAIEDQIPDGKTTVGTHVDLDHSAPTAVGATVTATATVKNVEGRAIEFMVRVAEGADIVAAGRHTRFIVDRERFMERLRAGSS